MTVAFLKVSLYGILFSLSSISLQLPQILLSIILLKQYFCYISSWQLSPIKLPFFPFMFLYRLDPSHFFFSILLFKSFHQFLYVFWNFYFFPSFTIYSFQVFWFSVKCGLHLVIQDSEGASWKSRTKLSKNMKNSWTIFSFSLYAMLLQVTQVAYFRLRAGNLKHGKPLEGSKMCCH